VPPELTTVRFTHEPLHDLDLVLAATAVDRCRLESPTLPMRGGWIGYCSYDLGRAIEPRAAVNRLRQNDSTWPLIDLGWCPNTVVFDHVALQWYRIGCGDELLLVEPSVDHFRFGPWRNEITPQQYQDMVQRTVEYIAVGDIFQANIAQRFTARVDGSSRSLALEALNQALPWYGSLLELYDDRSSRSIVSLSPELFLNVNPLTRRVVTRPIKGTRSTEESVGDLIASAKDAAELHMIIDLMRNDLGRVCEFGSVSVQEARAIETHPTVHHGVGEVTGRLREGVTAGDLLRATFPGGSVTGAPKIRAMQIIDELEPFERGPYCGAIGCFSDCGAVQLNIAIRTMTIERDLESMASTAHYWAGAGIVADSIPRLEYEETLAKAAVVRGLVDGKPTAISTEIKPTSAAPLAASASEPAAAARCNGRSDPPRTSDGWD